MTLGSDKGLETFFCFFTNAPHRVTVYFFPCGLQGLDQGLRIWVISNPHLPLQNGLNRKVHGITIWRGRWPSVLIPEGLKIGFAPSLGYARYGLVRHPASGQVCGDGAWSHSCYVSWFMEALSPLKSQCRPWCWPSGIMIRGFHNSIPYSLQGLD